MTEDIDEALQDKGSHEPMRKQNAIDITVDYPQASSDNEAGDGHSIIKNSTDNQSLLCPQSHLRSQTPGSRRLSEDSDYCSSHNTSRSSLCYSLSYQGSSCSLRSLESGIHSMPPSIEEENAQANHVVSILDHPEENPLGLDLDAVVKGMEKLAILKSTESESAHTATDSPVHVHQRAQDQASATDSKSDILSTITETDEDTVGRESRENEKNPPDYKPRRTTRSLYLKTEGGRQRKFRKCKTQPIRTQVYESEDDLPYMSYTVSINKPTGSGQEAVTPEEDDTASATRPQSTGLETSASEIATHQSSVSRHLELQPGPPKLSEICELSHKLMILEDKWISLAQCLGMEQCEISEINEDERTLYGKINRVLTQWIQKSNENDRKKLADVLDSMPFNPTRIAQETLNKAHEYY